MTEAEINEIAAQIYGTQATEQEIRFARAILARQPAAIDKHAVPEGWKLVPVDPTPKMIDEAKRYTWVAEEDATEAGIWRHMLAASPPAPSVEQDERGALTPNQFAAIRAGCASLQKHGGYAPFGIVLQEMLDRARAASTSANVAKGAEASVDLLRMALFYLKGNLPDGPTDQELKNSTIRQIELLISATPAQPSNVAQGAEAVCEHEWEPITKPHKECVKCGDVRLDAAPPAQTTLTATCGQLIAACTAYNEEMRKRNTANVGMAVPDAMRKAIDAALTAAQSASEGNHAN